MFYTNTSSNPFTVWYIGTDPVSDDILPKTEVSFNASRRAEFEGGILYLNGAAFANISDLIARAESTGERDTAAESDARESYFVFEPGRLVYNTLELCNFVHRCVAVETPPVILIRESAKICTTEYVFSITYQLYHNSILPVIEVNQYTMYLLWSYFVFIPRANG